MKILQASWVRGLSWGAVLGWMIVLLPGCGSLEPSSAAFSDPQAPGVSAPVVPHPSGIAESVPMGVFRAGDLVTVMFSGIDPAPTPHQERIKDDGTITLPMIGAVVATNKTAGALQKEIHDRYVPQFYRRLVVVVTPLDQFYTVGGEVKMPGSKAWLGKVTVTQAIQNAGDFTDFANKKKVQLTRVNGAKSMVNCVKALQDSTLDPFVMPGDRIHVPRRW